MAKDKQNNVWMRPGQFAKKNTLSPQAVTNRIARGTLLKKVDKRTGVTLIKIKTTKHVNNKNKSSIAGGTA